MSPLLQHTKLLGYLQLQIGTRILSLPIQSLALKTDVDAQAPGGFFVDAPGKYGILVNDPVSQQDLEQQVLAASVDAVRYISRQVLN